MLLKGVLKKMKVELDAPIRYFLEFQRNFLCMNDLIGKKIQLDFLYYECLNCSSENEIYKGGYCKRCFFVLPQSAPNIIRPELSTAHLNIEKRNLKWEKAFELQPHVVYLADTGNIKVGVTTQRSLPTRWIDQGALKAIKFAQTPNRYLAGIIELALKKKISDKSNYRKMLSYQKSENDLMRAKYDLQHSIPLESKAFFSPEDAILSLTYPIEKYPSKIQSIQLKLSKSLEKKLIGIKGQYLVFQDDSVINIRNHEGFYVSICIV